MRDGASASFLQKVWLRGSAREIAEARGRRDNLEEAVGPFQFQSPGVQHLRRERWTARQRQMLIALCDETPFADLCADLIDLAPALIAVSFLAYRKLVEPGPEGCEPRLTTRGLIAGDRMKDALAFNAVAS